MSKEESRHKLYTQGPILRALVFLSLPILLGNLLQTAYQITDAFWVGRLGQDAVASVSLSFPVIFLIITLSGGIGMAGAVLVSQHKGRKEHDAANQVSGQTFLLAFIFSFLFSVLGYIFAPQIIGAFGPEPSVFQGAVSYLRISFLGLVFVFLYMVYQSLSRAVGEANIPVYIVLATVLLNFILDPLFIFGWGFIPALGVGGAAMATLLTQAAALAIGLLVLWKGKTGIRLELKHFKIDRKIIKRIIFLGMPISLEQTSRSVGFILITFLASSFGTIALASYGIGSQMIGLVIIPALSISIANSTLVGHNIGAGKISRAEKITRRSLVLSFIFLSAIGIIFMLFSRFIVNAFISSQEQEVIAEGSFFLRIVALSFGFIGLQMAVLGALRGAGKAKTTLLASASVVVFQTALAFILAKIFLRSQNGIWYAFPISNVFGALLALLLFFKGAWKKDLKDPGTKERIEEECQLAECE